MKERKYVAPGPEYACPAHQFLCDQLIVGQEIEEPVTVGGSVGSSGVALLLDKVDERELVIQLSIERAKESRALGDALSLALLILDVRQHAVRVRGWGREGIFRGRAINGRESCGEII